MHHNIQVKSRIEALEYAQDTSIFPCVIISINGYGEPLAKFPDEDENPQILDVLPLVFDDEEGGITSMTPQNAYDILDFVEKWLDEDVDIIVHCGAGVSRSAGVAAALSLLVNGDDSNIFDDGRYSPNMHCYRSVLKASGLEYSEEDASRKHDHQFQLWLDLAYENGLL